jgi:hypothetical protein
MAASRRFETCSNVSNAANIGHSTTTDEQENPLEAVGRVVSYDGGPFPKVLEWFLVPQALVLVASLGMARFAAIALSGRYLGGSPLRAGTRILSRSASGVEFAGWV